MHSAVVRFVLATSLTLSYPALLGAQEISGQVIDATSGQPVAGVVALRSNRDYLTVRLFGSHVGGIDAGARQELEAASDCPPVLFVDGKWWGSIDEAGCPYAPWLP